MPDACPVTTPHLLEPRIGTEYHCPVDMVDSNPVPPMEYERWSLSESLSHTTGAWCAPLEKYEYCYICQCSKCSSYRSNHNEEIPTTLLKILLYTIACI